MNRGPLSSFINFKRLLEDGNLLELLCLCNNLYLKTMTLREYSSLLTVNVVRRMNQRCAVNTDFQCLSHKVDLRVFCLLTLAKIAFYQK